MIYPNFTSLRTNDLSLPVVEVNKQVWKSSTTSFVSTDISLSRSVWMSGAPIYVTVNIHNATTYTVSNPFFFYAHFIQLINAIYVGQ